MSGPAGGEAGPPGPLPCKLDENMSVDAAPLLRAAGHDPAGLRVLQLGCGGAGRAIAFALARAGAALLAGAEVSVMVAPAPAGNARTKLSL